MDTRLVNMEAENGKPFARVRVGGTSTKYGSNQAMHNTVGVTKLMQQCTSMLREKMWNENHSRPAPPSLRFRDSNAPSQPESALEAMGPVLESVLGSLTQEYEKRLLLKDQEIKTAQDQLDQLRGQVARLELMSSEGKAVGALEYQMSAEDRAEYERLQHLETELSDKLQGHTQQLDVITTEYRSLKQENMRLEISCKEYQEKVLAGERFLNNYKSIQEENRKLYNLVQDLRGNIRVFCRIRPLGSTGDTTPSCVSIGDEGQIAIYKQQPKTRNVFAYDKIFGPSSTQEEVYYETQPLIRSVLDGFNVCIFAYGQTGSGKTHTMTGSSVEKAVGRGINYRALDDLFDLQHQRKAEAKYTIKVQMLEVYNENVRDLLCEDSSKGSQLDILNTKGSGSNVPSAIYVDVDSTQDVLDVMKTGSKNRLTAVTKMNERSSRSHSVLTVIVDGHNTVTGQHTHGCLHLIDLAGSERVNKSEAVGERLEEAKFINKSLSAIGDVMSALASKSPHVPFRNSKLTQLLADSLSGKAKVMMFVHISPEATSHGESLSSMKFGSRVSEITLGQAKRNVESGSALAAKEAHAKFAQQLSEKALAVNTLQAALEAKSQDLRRTQADAAASQQRTEALEAQLRELQSQVSARNAATLNSDHSVGSQSNSHQSHTPRSQSKPLRRAIPSTSASGSVAAAPPSAEEKHILRMRAHLERKAMSATGLPTRPRTSAGSSAEMQGPSQSLRRTSRPASASASSPTPRGRPHTTR